MGSLICNINASWGCSHLIWTGLCVKILSTHEVREASAVSNRNFRRLLVQTTVTVCWSRPTLRKERNFIKIRNNIKHHVDHLPGQWFVAIYRWFYAICIYEFVNIYRNNAEDHVVWKTVDWKVTVEDMGVPNNYTTLFIQKLKQIPFVTVR